MKVIPNQIVTNIPPITQYQVIPDPSQSQAQAINTYLDPQQQPQLLQTQVPQQLQPAQYESAK